MIEIVNRQRKRKIESKQWVSIGQQMLEAIGKQESSATIAFVSDAGIRKLNRQFRGIDRATDVLSFPAAPDDMQLNDMNLGDIAISAEMAAAQAKENGLTFDGEIAQLILHGLLHLSGYDHETDNGEMNRLELRLRRKLGL
jgi:probable rRNA maturation factor